MEEFGHEGMEAQERETIKRRVGEEFDKSITTGQAISLDRLLPEVQRTYGVGKPEAREILREIYNEYIQELS